MTDMEKTAIAAACERAFQDRIGRIDHVLDDGLAQSRSEVEEDAAKRRAVAGIQHSLSTLRSMLTLINDAV